MARGSGGCCNDPGCWSAMVMECVGTLLYTFIASGAVVATANVAFQPQVASPATLTTIALAAGWGYTAVLYMMQTMTRNAVGYCNPAITVAVWLFGSKRYGNYFLGDSLFRMILFLAFQCVGAFGGAVLIRIIIPGAKSDCTPHSINQGTCVDMLAGAPQQAYGESFWQAFTFEIVGTFFITWVVMHTSSPLRSVYSRNASSPLAIGMVVTALTICAQPFSGASFNPARAFASYLVSFQFAGTQSWAYLFGPPIGAIAAGFTYSFAFKSAIRDEGIDQRAVLRPPSAAEGVAAGDGEETKRR